MTTRVNVFCVQLSLAVPIFDDLPGADPSVALHGEDS